MLSYGLDKVQNLGCTIPLHFTVNAALCARDQWDCSCSYQGADSEKALLCSEAFFKKLSAETGFSTEKPAVSVIPGSGT